jgi:hypothetical protein
MRQAWQGRCYKEAGTVGIGKGEYWSGKRAGIVVVVVVKRRRKR